MEYDPAVSTHKASSITSTTSTSSNSTWDHPISSYIPNNSNLKSDEQDAISNLEDYHLDAVHVSDRIVVPPFEFSASNQPESYSNIKGDFDSFLDSFTEETGALPELIPPPHLNDNKQQADTIYIKKEYHEKDGSNSENCFHKRNEPDQLNNMTHDNIFSSSNAITPTPIYLQHGDQVTVPSVALANNWHRKTSLSSSQRYSQQNTRTSASSVRLIRPLPDPVSALTREKINTRQCRQRSNSISSITSSSKRSRLNKDLLTEDEKRINHIASEQKRRNTIRLGFKDLTDIIPTLKNINNSKSTILFKAVEFIKHLDKRNRGLREKVSSLQVRMNVEGRMMEQQQKRHRSNAQRCDKAFSNYNSTTLDYYNPQQPQQHHYHHRLPSTTNDVPESHQQHEFNHLPANTVSALIAHKNQQRQLEELQEQLRLQQQLLVKHNILPNASNNSTSQPTSSSNASFTQGPYYITTTTTAAPTTAATTSTVTASISNVTSTLHQPNTYQYNSISIPSSRSSNSDEDENIHNHHQSLIVPQDLQQQHEASSSSQSMKRRPWQSADA